MKPTNELPQLGEAWEEFKAENARRLKSNQAPNSAPLGQMERLANELNCVVVYRLGMFHFIPQGANPTMPEIVSSVEAACGFLQRRALTDAMAAKLNAILERSLMYEYPGDAGSYRIVGDIDLKHIAQAALDACRAEELADALLANDTLIREIRHRDARWHDDELVKQLLDRNRALLAKIGAKP